MKKRKSIRSTVERIPVFPMRRRGAQGVRLMLQIVLTNERFYAMGLDEEGRQFTPSREPFEHKEIGDLIAYLTESIRHLIRHAGSDGLTDPVEWMAEYFGVTKDELVHLVNTGMAPPPQLPVVTVKRRGRTTIVTPLHN